MKYGLEFTGAPRVRRTWGGTLLTVLTLLLLSALVGWLWSCVRVAAGGGQTLRLGGFGTGRMLPLAVMPPMHEGVIVGLLVSLLVLALVLTVVCAVRRQRAEDAEDGFDVLGESGCAGRMDADEARRIVEACRSECRAVLMLVESAQRTMCLDDYVDALRGAHRRQEQVVRTLGDLARALDGLRVEGEKTLRLGDWETERMRVGRARTEGERGPL